MGSNEIICDVRGGGSTCDKRITPGLGTGGAEHCFPNALQLPARCRTVTMAKQPPSPLLPALRLYHQHIGISARAHRKGARRRCRCCLWPGPRAGPGRGDRTPSRARVGFGSAFVLPAAVRQRAPGCGGERRPQLPLSAVLACRGSAAAGGSGGSAGVRLLARQFSNVAWSASETSQMTAGGGLHLLWPGAEATSSALLRMYCDSIR